MNRLAIGIIGGLDLLLMVGALLVGLFLCRKGINGICQLTLGSMGVWRLLSIATLVTGTIERDTTEMWLVNVAFGYFVLYTVVHLANLVAEARRCAQRDGRRTSVAQDGTVIQTGEGLRVTTVGR